MSDVHIKFLFSKEALDDRLKYNDLKMLRKIRAGEGLDLEKLQIVACRFMADENNQFLPYEQAFDLFGELSKREAEDALLKFVAVFSESSLPNVNGRQLNSTSQANSLPPPQTTSPTGSTS
jgi:hypothetical protein